MPRKTEPVKQGRSWQYQDLPQWAGKGVAQPELPTAIEIFPLPEEASGFRKKKDASACMPSACIPNLTVGEVRRCMTQIRKAGPHLRTEHLLCCGWPAGYFALSYIIGHYMNRRTKYGPDEETTGKRKRRRKAVVAEEEEEEEDDEEDETVPARLEQDDDAQGQQASGANKAHAKGGGAR